MTYWVKEFHLDDKDKRTLLGGEKLILTSTWMPRETNGESVDGRTHGGGVAELTHSTLHFHFPSTSSI